MYPFVFAKSQVESENILINFWLLRVKLMSKAYVVKTIVVIRIVMRRKDSCDFCVVVLCWIVGIGGEKKKKGGGGGETRVTYTKN